MPEKTLKYDIAVIRANRNTLDALTEALMKKNHLNRTEIEEVLGRAPLVRADVAEGQ
ncbi:MAG: hypothetical protein K6G61_08485 [Solobacterium sp.]|nr:hypothetical protein [Solobacterium sp.]